MPERHMSIIIYIENNNSYYAWDNSVIIDNTSLYCINNNDGLK